MFCNCSRGLLANVRDKVRNKPRLTGTFDFRWPTGSTIRIAFQEGASKEATALGIERVDEALKAWGLGTTLQHGGPALAYQLIREPLFPAAPDSPEALDSVLDDEKKRAAMLDRVPVAKGTPHDEKRAEQTTRVRKNLHATNNFVTELIKKKEGRLAKSELARHDGRNELEALALDYDVLISFAPMPIVIPGNDHLESAARVILYAQSELGAYARREDLGLPTTFLGRPPGFKPPAGSDPDVSWLDSDEGRFTMHHELGHVLGLAHEHQNPLRKGLDRDDWRPKSEILAILRRRGLEPIYEDFVDFDLTEKFPLLPGAERFSQWRIPSAAEEAIHNKNIESVMIEPIYRCLLRSRDTDHKDCLELPRCPFEQDTYKRLSAPSVSDRAFLQAIYPGT